MLDQPALPANPQRIALRIENRSPAALSVLMNGGDAFGALPPGERMTITNLLMAQQPFAIRWCGRGEVRLTELFEDEIKTGLRPRRVLFRKALAGNYLRLTHSPEQEDTMIEQVALPANQERLGFRVHNQSDGPIELLFRGQHLCSLDVGLVLSTGCEDRPDFEFTVRWSGRGEVRIEEDILNGKALGPLPLTTLVIRKLEPPVAAPHQHPCMQCLAPIPCGLDCRVYIEDGVHHGLPERFCEKCLELFCEESDNNGTPCTYRKGHVGDCAFRPDREPLCTKTQGGPLCCLPAGHAAPCLCWG